METTTLSRPRRSLPKPFFFCMLFFLSFIVNYFPGRNEQEEQASEKFPSQIFFPCRAASISISSCFAHLMPRFRISGLVEISPSGNGRWKKKILTPSRRTARPTKTKAARKTFMEGYSGNSEEIGS